MVPKSPLIQVHLKSFSAHNYEGFRFDRFPFHSSPQVLRKLAQEKTSVIWTVPWGNELPKSHTEKLMYTYIDLWMPLNTYMEVTAQSLYNLYEKGGGGRRTRQQQQELPMIPLFWHIVDLL